MIVFTEQCRLECYHGYCHNQRCVCYDGWSGALCDQLKCDPRCDGVRGICNNGTCQCLKGYNGKHCSLGKPHIILHGYAEVHPVPEMLWSLLILHMGKQVQQLQLIEAVIAF